MYKCGNFNLFSKNIAYAFTMGGNFYIIPRFYVRAETPYSKDWLFQWLNINIYLNII